MRVPLSWLKEFVELDLSEKALSDVLTLAGLEVDKVEATPFSFKGVVVAEVKETAPHPNADKLTVAQVFDGSETVQVVCGDPKCAAGMKVALATVGATLEDEGGKSFKIKRSKLRDVESFGMLCAGSELGLSEDDSGILSLGKDAPLGVEISELFGDVVFEISLTPNLGHCMSMLGMGRDVAALLDQKAKRPNVVVNEGSEKIGVSVSIEDLENCRRYCAREIRGIRVGPSPDWMKSRLENAGVRSINNIVDVTNYVMLELGQPLHAFDGKKVRGQKISVQSTTQPISFETLDGEKRKIPENTLMIHDDKGPIAVAGVMGGANSEVEDGTTDIILESAFFDPSAVRRGSKALNLRSESSARFERGVDFEMVPIALDRAAELIAELGGGVVQQGRVDIIGKEKKRKTIKIRLDRTNQILGTKLSLSEIESFLKRLEMGLKGEGDALHVTVPSYRNDIHGEIDLIEEVARIFGYNNIKKREARVVNSPLPHAAIYLMEKKVREKLIEAGLQEFLTCDLISPELTELCLEKQLGEKEEIKVLKPSSVDQSILRMSLLPGMLQAVKHNFDRKTRDIHAFEIGKIHFKDGDHYRERLTAGVLLTGKRRPHHWEQKAEETDFFDLKGILENIIENGSYKNANFKSFHPGKQASIEVTGSRLGVMGEVHPERLKRLDIEERVFFAQIDLHEWMATLKKDRKMTSIPQFPGSDRDWTVTLDRDVPLGTVFELIQSFRSKLLKESMLLDVYESEKLGKDKKNVTFRFIYRDDRKTIEQSQVDKEHERLTAHIQRN
ncbi:MAG: phenylalanine--tRNA ligase subunit beta [Simkaniaceae bacterium]|nr:MAG: phenylalanine--tRNA ligase subunit beta [Simkaniaceae bacterium]